MTNVLVLGDINLKNVTDAKTPFAIAGETLRAADVVLANLECCLFTPAPQDGQHGEDKAFHADPQVGREALTLGNVSAVGVANNVNFGTSAILSSLSHLDAAGVKHSGAGIHAEAANAPVIIESKGSRIGFFQRSTLYWLTGHAATQTHPGIAIVAAHTAYQVPMHGNALKDGTKPMNRAGIPPQIVTWADPRHLEQLRIDIVKLREQTDYVVVSVHWGLDKDVLAYMEQIGRAAIDAGADMVFGHGPHYSLPIEMYRGKPIFYGLGSFSFHTGHGGKHGAWVGMLVKLELDKGKAHRLRVQFVRNNERNETVLCALGDVQDTVEEVSRKSAAYGTSFRREGEDLLIEGLA